MNLLAELYASKWSKLLSGQHMLLVVTSDWTKCHDTILAQFSQSYCMHVPNMKRIPKAVAELYPIENAGAGISLSVVRCLIPKPPFTGIHNWRCITPLCQ